MPSCLCFYPNDSRCCEPCSDNYLFLLPVLALVLYIRSIQRWCSFHSLSQFEAYRPMAKTKKALRECGRWICHSFDILKAIIIRLVFALHATIAVIRIVYIKGDYWYLLNLCGVNFLLIELIITIIKRKGALRQIETDETWNIDEVDSVIWFL